MLHKSSGTLRSCFPKVMFVIDGPDQKAKAHLLQGRVFRPTSMAEVAEAVDQAFDYRGDVTLGLPSGVVIEGYLFNRNARAPRPSVQVFPKHEAGVREVAYEEIVTIVFTGEDTASGKSWEAWIAKKEAQRQAEAEQAATAARARGQL